MTSFTRSALTDFDFGIAVYAGATVAAYTVDTFGNKTAFLATLYEDLTSSATLSNPQTLDGFGKWTQPIYIDAPVILAVTGANGVPDHQTGVISANLAGDAATEAAASAQSAVGFLGSITDILARVRAVYKKFTALGFPLDLTGQGLKFVRVNGAGGAYEFRSPTQVRSDLSLGTSAIVDTGTSGAKVALTNGANAWSGNETASGTRAQNGTLTMGAAFVETQATDISAGATIDLGALAGNLVNITGSGTVLVTSLGTIAAGKRVTCRVTGSGAFTLQNNANITLPGGANILLNQNDVFAVRGITGGSCIFEGRVNYAFIGQLFTSTAQTITSAGALTISHGLSIEPVLVWAELQCQTGEAGFTAGQHVSIGIAGESSNRGIAVVKGATSIGVRFGSDAATFEIPHATTGVTTALTNVNWKLVLKALA